MGLLVGATVQHSITSRVTSTSILGMYVTGSPIATTLLMSRTVQLMGNPPHVFTPLEFPFLYETTRAALPYSTQISFPVL